MASAECFGFVEVDRDLQQVFAVDDEQPPSALPAGVDVVTLIQHPKRWATCFETFGKEVLADFAVYTPLEISAEQWHVLGWRPHPMTRCCTPLSRTDVRSEVPLSGLRSTMAPTW